jgi:hypothetical protein
VVGRPLPVHSFVYASQQTIFVIILTYQNPEFGWSDLVRISDCHSKRIPEEYKWHHSCNNLLMKGREETEKDQLSTGDITFIGGAYFN